ncbi:conserved membrane hypothetical protein [uncultured Desulfobacterium sp.]|uniref:ResB-like domain-containing protein n=1 Tax=uncultured Desulfobacterium sp. TaxID=201089 RepID=A0A445N1C4_9BACT|nr:conserved membrane hypothetical protein [uncultured Desulfobacterium sp.]
MSRVTEQLSSLGFATWTLVTLFLWFVIGTILCANQNFFAAFREMNMTLTRDWLFNQGHGSTFLKAWFIGLCLIMVVMGINLVFCSWNRILKIMRHRFSGAMLFMLVVHIIFGLVALGHLGGFMLGYKYDDVGLKKGETFSFEDDLQLKLLEVHFVDDAQVLNKTRRDIKNGEFHYKENFVEVALQKANQVLTHGRVYLLEPFHHGNLQVTLKRFTPPEADPSSSSTTPGVMVAIACNPILKVFLIIYPLMILGIGVHLVMTWQRPEKEN